MENWKPIPNTNGRYLVSDKGRVKSLCGRTERILKPTRHRIRRKCGDAFYLRVRIDYDVGAPTDMLVHRLVAQAFIPNPHNYPIVNHKDENHGNNRADNLEWRTYKYNANYGNAQKRRMESARMGGNK